MEGGTDGRLCWIVQCFTSPPTQYRLYGRRVFTGQKTQPTVSKYWRKSYGRTDRHKHCVQRLMRLLWERPHNTPSWEWVRNRGSPSHKWGPGCHLGNFLKICFQDPVYTGVISAKILAYVGVQNGTMNGENRFGITELNDDGLTAGTQPGHKGLQFTSYNWACKGPDCPHVGYTLAPLLPNSWAVFQ